jgi:DNA end-binding protein Ku
MRTTVSGALSLGRDAIPVTMHSPVRSKDRFGFRTLHNAEQSVVRYDRGCETEGLFVPWNEIVKGYESTKAK